MPSAPPHLARGPRARAAALVAAAAFAVTTAVAGRPEAAAASVAYAPAGPARAHVKSAKAVKSRAKARTKARAKLRGSARLHTRAAKAHARVHTRRHARLHALTTVAAADAGVPDESATSGASLRGSHAAVDRAYDAAVNVGAPFVHSESELARRANEGEYVPLARSTATYQLKGVSSAYVRPATRDWVTRFAADYARECGEPLTVTSALRPTTIRLRNSVQKSVHPTGMAVDLRASRTGCRTWMRETLLDQERDGTIDATEEHHPPHFHVVVLRAP